MKNVNNFKIAKVQPEGVAYDLLEHSVCPPFFCWMGGEGWASFQIFKKEERHRISILEGVAGKERGAVFWQKNKIKSEIFNDKILYKTKIFFSVITKNLNWEILN